MGILGIGEEAPEGRKGFSAVKKPGKMNGELGNGLRWEGIGARIECGRYSAREGGESSGEESLLGVTFINLKLKTYSHAGITFRNVHHRWIELLLLDHSVGYDAGR